MSSTIVRILFGYSFATWRFHLRGLSIRGAHDVGWISDMTVGRLMRTDAKTVPENLGLAALRAAYPAGGTKRLYVVDGAGHYTGTIDTDELHDTAIDDALDGAVAGDLAEERRAIPAAQREYPQRAGPVRCLAGRNLAGAAVPQPAAVWWAI